MGLHCSDCHLNEANAHGTRNTWYMLSNSTGTDVAFANGGYTTSTNVCMRCHAGATYAMSGGAAANSRYPHATCSTARAATSISTLGAAATMNCLGCHGGDEFGGIHGTNGTYSVGRTGTVSKKYRFMGSGGAMRFYSPNGANITTVTDANWETGTTSSCYTIAAADSWGSCTQHNGRTWTPTAGRARPLSY